MIRTTAFLLGMGLMIAAPVHAQGTRIVEWVESGPAGAPATIALG